VTAQPVFPIDSLAEDRTWLCDVAPHGPQFRGAGGRRTARAIQRIVERLDHLEVALHREQTARAAAEDQYLRASGDLRAWQRYAGALRLRRDALADAIQKLAETPPDLRPRWWHLPARRRQDERLADACDAAMLVWSEREPEPPEEPAA
jgi:hypothetical protein